MSIIQTRIVPCIAAAAAIAAVSLSAYGGGDHETGRHLISQHDDGHGHAVSRAGNPLIEEMIKLDAVFREVVSGVAMGDSRRVQEALEQMHGSMEKTHEGVDRGTVVLRKNPSRLEEFVEQDKQFHATLEDLAHAARKNDAAAMLSLTSDLLDRCVRCHRDFRAS